MGQLLNGSGGGLRLKYNLFVQPTEPDVKNGLWIKTPTPVPVSDILLKGSYIRAGHFSAVEDNPFAQIPNPTDLQGDFMGNTPLVNGRYVYIGVAHGSYPASGYIMEYDLLTNTMLTKTVAGFYIGGCIYNFQGIIIDGDGVPRFNTNTNSFSDFPVTQYPHVTSSDPYSYSYACACDNERIYIANTDSTSIHTWTPSGGSSGTYAELFTNTSLPESPTFHNSVIVAGKLYVFSTTYGVRILNLTTGNVTTGASFPSGKVPLGYGQGGYPIKIGSDIFIFSSAGSSIYTMLSYNTDTNTFTVYDDNTSTAYEMLVYISGKGILCNARPYPSYKDTCITGQFALESQVEPANTLCLLKGIKNQFWVLGTEKLMKTLPQNSANILNSEYYSAPKPDFSIDDAWYYDTDFKEYPTYIGNGSTWTKIKN